MIALHKCRMCGEVIEGGRCNKNLALQLTIQLALGIDEGLQIHAKDIHTADNHIGIADFIGFKDEEE